MYGINTTEFPNEKREQFGRHDAHNSVNMSRPIHENWRNENSVLVHFDPAYIKGYVNAWKALTGKLLIVTGVIYD